MEGFGTLQTPRDFLGKLRREHARLVGDRTNEDVAMNFFINAYHLLDWLHPGRVATATAERKRMEDTNILLQVTSHIANGSKHFRAEDRRHQFVQHVDAPPAAFESDAFDANAFQTG